MKRPTYSKKSKSKKVLDVKVVYAVCQNLKNNRKLGDYDHEYWIV